MLNPSFCLNGIGLIWSKSKRPIEQGNLNRFQASVAYRMPTHSTVTINNHITYAGFFRDLSSAALDSAQIKRYQISFHGFLYNRNVLAGEIEHGNNEQDCDAALVLKAYIKWGDECVSRFDGAFAFAIMDTEKNEVFCARDFMGLKPFCYSVNSGYFACASDSAALQVLDTFSHEANDLALANHVSNRLKSRTETIFRSIERLPAGHQMRVGQRGVVVKRYHYHDFNMQIRYKNPQCYFDHLSELMERGMLARNKVHSTLGLTMSGGIDSSAVAGKVFSMRRNGALTKGFDGIFSMVFPGLSCDESDYIGAVEHRWGFSAERVSPTLYPHGEFHRQAVRFGDWPIHPHRAIHSAMATKVNEKGINTLVTGFGSDELFTGSSYYIADCLRSFQLAGILQKRSRYGEWESDLVKHHLLLYGIRPLVPEWMRNALRAVRSPSRKPVYPAWLGPRTIELLSTSQEQEDDLAGDNATQYRYLTQGTIHRTLESAWMQQAIEQTEKVFACHQVSETHLFLDKSIVEFAFAIPEAIRWSGAENKYVLRKAMHGAIPNSILQRKEKTTFEEVQFRAFESVGGLDYLENLTAYDEGWLSRDLILEKARVMTQYYQRSDSAYADHVWPIWCAISMEIALGVL